MNYNTVFAPTVAAEHNLKAHWLNLPTYFYIAVVALLTATIAAFDWATEQLDCAPEYAIQLKLAKVRAQRRIVRFAIRAEQVRLTAAPRLVAAMDRIFCLEG